MKQTCATVISSSTSLALAYLLLFLIPGCAGPNTNAIPVAPTVSPSIQVFADPIGLDYRDELTKCLDGSTEALTRLIEFSSEPDGEAAIDHGQNLLYLEKKVGRHHFREALASVSVRSRRFAAAQMAAAKNIIRHLPSRVQPASVTAQ